MTRREVFLMLCLLITLSCSSESLDRNLFSTVISFDTSITGGWLSYLCSDICAGRVSGTEGNVNAREYICGELRKMGYAPTMSAVDASGVDIRNIYVHIDGNDSGTIVIGAHYDGACKSTENEKYQSANDNASGAVALLNIAKALSEEEYFPKNIELCFWDGEENNCGGPYKGSRDYVKHLSNQVDFYLNFDSCGHTHDNSLKLTYNDKQTAQIVKSIKKNTRLSILSTVYTDSKGASDYVSFAEIGIPYLAFSNDLTYECGHENHTVGDTVDAISISYLHHVCELGLCALNLLY